jgi:FSR family fosmidomycin resistance protein-like MFS transporter
LLALGGEFVSADVQHKTRTLWLVGALHAFTHVYQIALMPLYLLIQRDFKFASVAQATSMVTVLMVAYLLPSYGLGVLADRVNRRKLLGYGLLINGLGFVALSFAPNYGWAVFALILAGIGGSFYHPAATAMVARLFPTNTGKALGLTGIGASVGFFVGPLFAGWRAASLELSLGAAAWRQPVLELGVLGVLGAGVFAWLARDEVPRVTPDSNPTPHAKIFPTTALWLWFFATAFAFSLRDFAGASMGSLGSLYLQKVRGFDVGAAGLALSGLFLASAVSNPLFGSLSDRGRKRWTAFVLMVAAVLVGTFPHSPVAWTIPTYLVYGFFFLASYPMVEAALMQSVPDAVRGRVFGLFITVGGLIGNLSHWIVGNEVRRMGDAAHEPASYFMLYRALAGMIVLSLLGLPCLHAIRKREHLDEDQIVKTSKC